jgi:hypothetical protein
MSMEKVYITNHVKSEILNICGLSNIRPYNLNGFTSLFTLGFSTTPQCKLLEGKLQEIAAQYNTGKYVIPDTISSDFTVNECVELIMTKTA